MKYLNRMLLLVLVFACTYCQAEEIKQGPKIHFDETTLDFGGVLQNTQNRHTFTFTNTGGQTLVIHRLYTSCGCTAAVANETKIEPGQSGKIDVDFHSKEFKGEVTKVVRVYTNDPGSPAVLKITANVMRAIECDSGRLRLDDIGPVAPVKRTVRVYSPIGQKFKIVGVTTSAKFITAAAAANEDGSYTVTVTIDPAAAPSRFDESIYLQTDMASAQNIRISVVGSVKLPVKADPQKLYFGTTAPSEKTTKTIEVTKTTDQQIALQSITCSDRLSATAKETASGWQVTVVLANPPSGIFRGQIRISFEGISQSLVVPVFALSAQE